MKSNIDILAEQTLSTLCDNYSFVMELLKTDDTASRAVFGAFGLGLLRMDGADPTKLAGMLALMVRREMIARQAGKDQMDVVE